MQCPPLGPPGEGAPTKRSQLANFARESNPASPAIIDKDEKFEWLLNNVKYLGLVLA